MSNPQSPRKICKWSRKRLHRDVLFSTTMDQEKLKGGLCEIKHMELDLRANIVKSGEPPN